jgi:hypothetical protein
MPVSYKITEAGNFRVEFPVELSVDGRTQLVFIDSKTKLFYTDDVMEIWFPVYSCNGPIAAEIANKLLNDNAEHLVGSWEGVTDSEGTSVVLFKTVYKAEHIKKWFGLILFSIASTADEMEKKLTGEDKY